jgi:two-component system OmpR family sensor kinase
MLVVRVTLRPLSRVAATAGRVAELRLDRGEVALAERVSARDTDPRTEVGQVGGALNRMLEHVASALEARQASETQLRQFLADASHELRTPLAAVRGYAELIRRHPEEIAHPLSRLESEAARMSLLVDELLLLARLDAGRPLAREPVDLTLLAVTVTSDARVVSPGHRWQLDLPDQPVMVIGDEHRLHQILANLTNNAAKHTPPGTTITVTLAAGPAQGTVQLSVTDDGPGIPAGLQPSVFERFARGDPSRSRASGSTGLGLAIVEAVTTAHGGAVSLTSRPGHTHFAITLPGLNPAANPAPESATGASPAPHMGTPSQGSRLAAPPAGDRGRPHPPGALSFRGVRRLPGRS